MPQTSKKIQDLIDKWFPQETLLDFECQDIACIRFLESRGWILNKDWTWTPPVSFHTQSYFEYICITYLIEEWDFGGEKNWFGKKGVCYCPTCLNKH